MSPAAKPWIAHYVAMKFFFVAFRYEPKDATAATMTSETVRIRFSTPNPYYPYMEPTHEVEERPRLLKGWIVTRGPMTPLAAHAGATADQRTWERPWEAGVEHLPKIQELAKEMGPELAALLPKAEELVMQPFRDQRSSRAGMGDVVLVPATPETIDAAGETARKHLLPAVDPTLLDETWSTASMVPVKAPEPPPPPRSGPCGVGSSTSSWGGGTVAGAMIALAFARRRRTLASATLAVIVMLVACKKAPPPVVTDASPASSAPRITSSREDREKVAMALLAGQNPGNVIAASPAWTPFVPAERGTASKERGNVRVAGQLLSGKIGNFERAIAGLKPRFRQCYARGLADDPKMSGTAVVELGIARDGSVSRALLSDVKGVSVALGECCKRALGNTQLEPPEMPDGAVAKAKVTLTFSPE